jgi:hypothetical protein
MAILSNINGKFAVDSTGAIQFSGAAGTADYVLVSGGAGAAPTWVDVDTIIGGPYLPLTGGTLAGAGNLVVGGTLTVNGIGTFNTPAGGVAFNLDAAADNYGTFRLRTNGNANKWDIGMKNDNDFYIYNQATSAQAFEIDTANNNATFSGNIEADVASGGGITIDSADVGTLKFLGSGSVYNWGLATTNLAASDFGIYKSNAAGGDPITAGTAQLYFKSTDSTTSNVGIGTTSPNFKLHVSGTGGADTLLRLENTTVNKYPNLRFTAAGAEYDIGVGGTGTATGYVHNLYVYDITNSAPRITLTQAGNVGIGTQSPAATLQVGGGSANVLQKIWGSGTAGIQIFTNSPSTGTKIVALEQYFSNEGYLGLYYNGTEKVRFRANDNSYINGGNLGIGTTTPGGKLHIKGNGLTQNLIRLQHDGTGGNGFFDINVVNDRANLVANYSSTAIPMRFITGAAERMRITSTGQLQLQGSSSSLAKSTTQTEWAYIPGNTPGASLMAQNPSGMSSASAGYHIVYGANNSSPYQAFIDVITYQCGSSTNVTVISSTTLNNSPGSRSYSKNSSAVFLNISGSVNYNCNIKTTFINFPH